MRGAACGGAMLGIGAGVLTAKDAPGASGAVERIKAMLAAILVSWATALAISARPARFLAMTGSLASMRDRA